MPRRRSAGPRWSSARAFRSNKRPLAFERAREEAHRALPGELRRLRVVVDDRQLLLVGGLVREGVLGVVAIELVLHARVLQLLLERVHAGDGEGLVARRPVAEERRLD